MLPCRAASWVTQRNLTGELSRAHYFDAVKPQCYLPAFMYESEELLTTTQAVCSEQHKCDGLSIQVMQNPLETTERLQLNPEDFESRSTRVKSAVLMVFLRGSCGKLEKGFQFLESKDYFYCFCKIIGSAFFPFQPMTQQHRSSELHGYTKDSLHSRSFPPSVPPVKMLQDPFED